jgi:hypothetical protein
MRRARDNPFAVHRVLRERYRLGDAEWSWLFARLHALGGRGAIVGPHGSGKTTLIEDLAERLQALRWRIHLLRFSTDDRRLPDLARWGREDFVLCDGAEQLSFIDWRRLRVRTARAGGFVITTHSRGRLPVLHRCETSAELLGELAASLAAPVSMGESQQLYERHGGDLRAAIRELYDQWSLRP